MTYFTIFDILYDIRCTPTTAEQEQEAPAKNPTEKPQEATTAPPWLTPTNSAQPMQEAAQSAPQVTYNAPMNGAGTPRTGAA